jgi:hypothetical protein
MLICKGKFQKCDHTCIYLAIHSHSAPIFRLRCISIARKKNLHLREELQHMTIVRIFFYLSLKYNSYFFMMYDVYWYCQMKKKRMIMKILKKEWFIWKFWNTWRTSTHDNCADFFYLSLKYNSYFHNILWFL